MQDVINSFNEEKKHEALQMIGLKTIKKYKTIYLGLVVYYIYRKINKLTFKMSSWGHALQGCMIDFLDVTVVSPLH